MSSLVCFWPEARTFLMCRLSYASSPKLRALTLAISCMDRKTRGILRQGVVNKGR